MYCKNCHSPFIIKVNTKLRANASVRICKSKAKVTEIYSKGFEVDDGEIDLQCQECGCTFEDIENQIYLECTECYRTNLAKDIGFVESKDSPVCITCHGKNFNDEIFIPFTVQLEQVRLVF